MAHIAIVSANVRAGRLSNHVALFLQKFINEQSLGTAEILDLQEFNFPIFEERFAHQKQPTDNVLEFARKIRSADGVVIVTPEYNGGYPASLKNVMLIQNTDSKHQQPVSI